MKYLCDRVPWRGDTLLPCRLVRGAHIAHFGAAAGAGAGAAMEAGSLEPRRARSGSRGKGKAAAALAPSASGERQPGDSELEGTREYPQGAPTDPRDVELTDASAPAAETGGRPADSAGGSGSAATEPYAPGPSADTAEDSRGQAPSLGAAASTEEWGPGAGEGDDSSGASADGGSDAHHRGDEHPELSLRKLDKIASRLAAYPADGTPGSGTFAQQHAWNVVLLARGPLLVPHVCDTSYAVDGKARAGLCVCVCALRRRAALGAAENE